MKATGIGLSDIGQHRATNEDHLLVDNDLGLYVVADGIGGSAGGDVASRLAISSVAQYLLERQTAIGAIRDGYGDETQLSTFAAAAVAAASRVVYRTAQANPCLAGMGCTMTLLLMGRQTAVMAHVGDSRLYLGRDDRVHQLSTDHNVAQELVELGAVQPEHAKVIYGGRSLTRAVGREEWLRIDELVLDIQPGDRFILCSDGLSDYLAMPGHLSHLLDGEALAIAPIKLIDFANRSGGHDNITAIIVDIEAEQPTMQTTGPMFDAFGEVSTAH